MKDGISQTTFSATVLSYAVGAAGFISALVTMFIDTKAQLSIKWLILLVWLFLTTTLVLLRFIFNLSNEKKPAPAFEIPIRYLPDEHILLIRKNDNFDNQIVVGCYSNVDDVERLLFLGAVHHVQDKFVQIKILPEAMVSQASTGTLTDLKSILVRPVVPLAALQAQRMGDIGQ